MWIRIVRHGGPRRRPRSTTTVRNQADSALKLLIALVGIHALYSYQARALPLTAIDFTRGRLTLGDIDHPLDAFTEQAAVDYIHLRHQRWPHTRNPHVFISSQTAHTRAPVTTGWMQPLLRGLPVTARKLREDRILEEAAVTGAEPQHLCAVFNITPETELRYTRFFHPRPHGQRRRIRLQHGDIVTDHHAHLLAAIM
ncbi:hypothetical protein [Streptomyces sp. NPDC005780]|uniref:hypothetical protein n=1 Tax=Streptomyces sp. NPDC005780 TaxID=3364730 RepID=UPI0036D19493